MGRLVQKTHEWCEEFGTVAKELKMEKPMGINVVSLSQDGKTIGLDGQELPKGHLDPYWKGGLLPFPVNCMSVVPLPLDEIKAMAGQYREIQDGFLQAMFLSPGVKEALAAIGMTGASVSDLKAVRCMRKGAATITAWLGDDCHKKMLTCYLPPTASMPDAVYMPEKIYCKDK